MTIESSVLIEAKEGVRDVLMSYLALGQRLEEQPQVSLKLTSQTLDGEVVGTRDVAITTALQCYASGRAILKPRLTAKEQQIAYSTLEAGHHTTRQHFFMTWRIDDISRLALRQIFHDYEFYNSEQQSQRYNEIKHGNYLIPADLAPEQRQVYVEAADFSNRAYFEMMELLRPVVRARVEATYVKGGRMNSQVETRVNEKTEKMSMEHARYVLPSAQRSVLYHDLSELSLIRLFRASQKDHFTDEARYVIAEMIMKVAEWEKRMGVEHTILEDLEEPLAEEEKDSYVMEYITEAKEEFDEELGDRSTVLADYPINMRRTIASTVRNVKGKPKRVLSDEEAIAMVLDPALNGDLADPYDPGIHDDVTRALTQVNLTYSSKFAGIIGEQRQRHRMTPGATPPIEANYDGKPDYVTPGVISEDPQLKERFDQIMHIMYDNVTKCLEAGVPKEYALMLLPNAHAIRVKESGNLFHWLHRWRLRLCYLAQDEFFANAVEQVKQLREILPEASHALLAPCGLRQRAGITPRCPEGKKWCGQAVYNFPLEEYEERRLI